MSHDDYAQPVRMRPVPRFLLPTPSDDVANKSPAPSPRTGAFWRAWALYLPARALHAAAWWALVTLLMSAIAPSVVLAGPMAQLRWIAIAGIITAAVGDFPVRGWRRPSA